MNKHDQQRRQKTIKALEKVKECLTNERLYLSVQGISPALYQVDDAEAHVEIALEILRGDTDAESS